ncbi:hypothetical protein GQ43DRAFT_447033 [Delitschia confertaspora ATCC 74209]|uniref:NAD(P)-binding domain-containing protein n=1 Tax=Delitschia confertaspora ATCC 74209 TaxID=1513339 RepID=A0A9P4MUS3_9PLEO|nr:hypothetical protein GQ43DRAFT_447033 [Delitschia confertaspora ATCC 74209]
MKLIVTGATGSVGTEVIPVTSLVAFSRRPINVPENSGIEVDTSKLQTAILEDWTKPYPESVKEQIKGADVCIWFCKDMDPAEVSKICFDYTINGLHTMTALAINPFRFVYTSGVATERDQTKALQVMGDHLLMCGRIEHRILEFAKERDPPVQGPGHPKPEALTTMFRQFGDMPWVHMSELAAAMIDQCLNGITKDPLWARGLVDMGSRVLREEEYVAASAF